MLAIYTEIFYYRQMMRLSPEKIHSFVDRVKTAAERNGAYFFSHGTALVCCFKENKIGYVFSAVEFLKTLAHLLDEHMPLGGNFYEHCVIIDEFFSIINEDEVSAYFDKFKKQILPDEGLFAAENATKILSPYIKFTYQPEFNLYQCSSFVSFSQPDVIDNPDRYSSPVLVLHTKRHYFWAIYNFIKAHPLSPEQLKKLTDNEKEIYDRTAAVWKFISTHRFQTNYPQYIIDAATDYARLYFRLYNDSNEKREPVSIFIEDTQNNKLMSIAKDVVAVSLSSCIYDLPAGIRSVKDMPYDLLELTYMVLQILDYVFIDELPEFFAFLGNDPDFLPKFFKQLHQLGILAISDNPYSFSNKTFALIREAVLETRKKLDFLCGEFFGKKYHRNELITEFELLAVLETFGYPYDDRASIESFFRSYSDAEIIDLDISEFTHLQLYPLIKNYQTALVAAAHNSFSEMLRLIKQLVGSFQSRSFFVGEYRALLLLGGQGLSKNRTDDSLTYFGYALANATQLHDSQLICEALTCIGITHFLRNDITTAQDIFDQLHQEIEQSFELQWYIPCLFMQGRLALKIGEYTKAGRFFSQAKRIAKQYFPDWFPICEIWEGRTLTHAGKIMQGQSLIKPYYSQYPDAALFFLESLLLSPIIRDDFFEEIMYPQSSRQRKAFSLLPVFTQIETAFSFTEDLIWGHCYQQPYTHLMFNAFLSYYRFKTTYTKNYKAEDVQEHITVLERITNSALMSQDICGSVYGYFCYDISVCMNGANAPESLTHLSRAFKALQIHTENIFANKIRDKFMQGNVWNKKLLAAARENKFI